METTTFFELFQKTGWVGYPLLLCSVVAVGIVLERVCYFLVTSFSYQNFQKKLFSYLDKNELEKAILLCRKQKNPVGFLAGLYLQYIEDKESRERVLLREGSFALEKVEARQRGLSAIINIAPLMGLLGTVTGLVKAFHQMEIATGVVNASQLASGIWEALLTTVFGLLIAIPCLVAYHAFESIADKTAKRMKLIVLDLDEFWKKKKKAQEFQGLSHKTDQKKVKA